MRTPTLGVQLLCKSRIIAQIVNFLHHHRVLNGLILNLVSKKHSLRFGGFLGAATFTIGSFTTIFISSTNQLPLTFGILQGIGFGMMVPVSYATMNFYFDKKRRTTVMSICKAVQGIILMGYPQLLRNFVSSYGFRGTLLIISGISLHTIPGMIIMRTEPVKMKAMLVT